MQSAPYAPVVATVERRKYIVLSPEFAPLQDEVPDPVRPLRKYGRCRKCVGEELTRRCGWDGFCWRSERARLLLERRRGLPPMTL
jgi:hypothetical protein